MINKETYDNYKRLHRDMWKVIYETCLDSEGIVDIFEIKRKYIMELNTKHKLNLEHNHNCFMCEIAVKNRWPSCHNICLYCPSVSLCSNDRSDCLDGFWSIAAVARDKKRQLDAIRTIADWPWLSYEHYVQRNNVLNERYILKEIEKMGIEL